MMYTPLISIPSLNTEMGFSVLFKREDKSVVFSHKFRPIRYQLTRAKEHGYTGVVISTSGNAGIALAKFASEFGMRAIIFVDHRIDRIKLSYMRGDEVFVIASAHPIRLANYTSAKYGFKNLRQSKDNDAIIGYESLGYELDKQTGLDQNISAVFTYVTSGASLLGMQRYFMRNKIDVPMHAVQSGMIDSVSRFFDDSENARESVAGFLGIRHTRRTPAILAALRKSGGRGWYVSEEQMRETNSLLEKHGIETSFEGVASFSALARAWSSGYICADPTKALPICILSGAMLRQLASFTTIYNAETFEDVDMFMDARKF